MKTAGTAFDVSWSAIAKVLLALALVWAWLQLWHIVMVLIISIVIAVALHPAVSWLERHGIPKGIGAFAVVMLLAAICVAMIAASWVTLRNDAELIVDRLADLSRQLRTSFPAIRQVVPDIENADAGQTSGASEFFFGVAQSATGVLGMIVLALVLAAYLLIEWKPTIQWLLAFVPERHRPRARRTLDDSRRILFRYAVGNVIASSITGVVTYVVLAALGIPAALVLALVSGVLNLIPVLGLILSTVLAAALAVTVSVNALLLVLAFYIVFNVLENYLITPKLFGHELELSDLAVLIAVIVGSELGGAMGALLSLPIAAIYPCVERIWLRERLTPDTVDIHEHLAAQEETLSVK